MAPRQARGDEERGFSCWVVTDGKAGMESQCVGLAEALGVTPIIKRVRLRAPWRMLTPFVRVGGAKQFARGHDLTPPWPDLVIATGRHSVAASLYVRAMSAKTGKRAVNVQIRNPVIAPDHFDLVVTPRHDRLEGANVLSTKGALHRVTAARLRDEAARMVPRFAALPRPFISVLIGGTNAAYRLGADEMTVLAARLAQAAKAAGGSVLATPSRRTGEENVRILEEALRDVPHFIWDGAGDNPYFGLLGLADCLVVTADSVNMVSEALATGKPVYVADLPGGSEKFARFHRALADDGLTRAFTGTLESYAYAPLDETRLVAMRVQALLDQR